MKPTRSQKRAVTSRRSSWRGSEEDVRGAAFAASTDVTSRGVSRSGADAESAGAADEDAESDEPQYPQKLESMGTDCPHEGQSPGSADPQKRQNRIPGGLAFSQEGQINDEGSMVQPSYNLPAVMSRIESGTYRYAVAGCSRDFSMLSMSFMAPRRRKISSASCCLPISERMRASA